MRQRFDESCQCNSRVVVYYDLPMADCPAPVNPSNGQVVIKGGIAIYLCDRGYILVGSSLRTCKDGAWTGDAPKCVQGLSSDC